MFEPTIEPMSPRALIPLLVAVVTGLSAVAAGATPILVLQPDGSVVAERDRYVDRALAGEPPPARAAAPRAVAAAGSRTPRALKELLTTGQIDQVTHDRALAAFRRAEYLSRSLAGGRSSAMRGIVAIVEGITRRGDLEAHRLPALVETMERNAEWWSTGPLLASGARVSFKGSDLVWQHYPGWGIQIQWLGTFGRANGYFADEEDVRFERLITESIALAADRAGGIAFEYLFPFGGGSPPWVSGLAQGTALSALSRAWKRLRDPAVEQAARDAVGIFRVSPPEGVRQFTPQGTHYLQYSYDTRLHILNGFIQSLNGLFDYASLLEDEEGWRLFEAGRRRATWELPRYARRGWSMYSEYTESSLAYHELLRGFLAQLCTRLGNAEMDPEPFCRYAGQFLLDVRRDPVIDITGGAGGRLRFTIDKPATVSVVVSRGAFSHRVSTAMSSGPHSISVGRRGTFSVTISATDLAGNSATVTESVRI